MSNITSSTNIHQTVKQLKTEYKATESRHSEQELNDGVQKVEKEVTVSSMKLEQNSAILQANLDVNISAGNEPLALLYKAAIEGINEALEPELGENAIQKAYDSGLDVSPEATADRIVSLSTAFFEQYQNQHPELSEQEAATKFAEIIGGGIDTGFSEAREILSGLNVLEGDIASNIDATYDLVQDGLKAFVESYSEPKAEEDGEHQQ